MSHAQLDRVVAGLRDTIGDALIAVILHGSLATGCFNERRSDVDLLVVTRRPIEDRAAVLSLLERESGSYDEPGWPRPLEVSALTLDQIAEWSDPPAYDLHFPGRPGPGVDPDLPAHVWVARRYGLPLYGPAPKELLPDVPEEQYLAALLVDARDAIAEGHEFARYAILTLCRVWVQLETLEFQTKDSGAEWAAAHLPGELRPLAERALESYRGDGRDFPVAEGDFRAFAEYISTRIEALA
jgi:streptomycin 3"-adenylyltransferase